MVNEYEEYRVRKSQRVRKKQSVEEQLAFKKRGHQQTAPTQDIMGSESTVME
jgi:hypothetical protein